MSHVETVAALDPVAVAGAKVHAARQAIAKVPPYDREAQRNARALLELATQERDAVLRQAMREAGHR